MTDEASGNPDIRGHCGTLAQGTVPAPAFYERSSGKRRAFVERLDAILAKPLAPDLGQGHIRNASQLDRMLVSLARLQWTDPTYETDSGRHPPPDLPYSGIDPKRDLRTH
jgi:hypothetical protein